MAEMEYEEVKNTIQKMAREINSLSSKEKLFYLQSIGLMELYGNINYFWANIAKKMLVSDELVTNIISKRALCFENI